MRKHIICETDKLRMYLPGGTDHPSPMQLLASPFSDNKAPLRMSLLAYDACARRIFVYEGAVKALPANHPRRHLGGTVVFVSDFGQQKLFHLKPRSITYCWKALFSQGNEYASQMTYMCWNLREMGKDGVSMIRLSRYSLMPRGSYAA